MILRNNPCFILCDFDGTISQQDVTDTLLERFGRTGYQKLEMAWKMGQIGSRTCMKEQIALLDMSPAELDDSLSQIQIDPAFKKFALLAKEHNIPIHIVSDGLDYGIHYILQQNGIDHFPVFANHLVYCGNRNWQLEFPYANPKCEKDSGHCKCKHVSERCGKTPTILYIGDSTSDFCVSGRANHVLAKNKLIAYCQQQNFSHDPISDFSEAISLWTKIISEIFALETEMADIA